MRKIIISLVLLLLLPLAALADIEAHFLDVGHGDAAIIIADGEAMIVDGGEAQYSDKIFAVLKSLGVTELKYAVATHPQSDHVGGLSSIFYAATVHAIYTPVTEYQSDRFTMLMKKTEENGVPVLVPAIGDTMRLGDATITVLSTAEVCDDPNDMSIVLRIDYGKTSFLLCGDASTSVEKALIRSGTDLDADVLKLAHHGSKSASSEAFVSAVRPRYAVISCSTRYDHPDKEVVDELLNAWATILRTDVNGDITISSDGQNISCGVDFYYIGNTKSDVFHRMTCNSVRKMKEEHKTILYTSEQAKKLEYRPCKNCSP